MTRGQKRVRRTRAKYRLTFETVVRDGVDVQLGLIYLWEVGLPNGAIYRYVGQAGGGDKRPNKHYARKCERYYNGLSYKGDDLIFREPHWQIGDAWACKRPITLTLLCNATDENINILEAHWQDVYELPRSTPRGRGRPSPYAGNPLPLLADPEDS